MKSANSIITCLRVAFASYFVLCQGAPDESNGVKYLLIGNPGTGKSTILNGFIGAARFHSGISFGQGKTKVLQKEVVGENTFIDTPGLADISLREQAAGAITSALSDGGVYKVFFVITLEAGRVRPEDKVTMELVLKSAPITHYGVIINKLEQKERTLLKSNEAGAYDQVVAGLMNGSPIQSLYFHFNMRVNDLEGETDGLMPIDNELGGFIQNVPPVEISPELVKPIEANQFAESAKKAEGALALLKQDREVLQKKMEEDRSKHEMMLIEMQQRNDQLMQKFLENQVQKNSSGGWMAIAGSILKAAVPLVPLAIGMNPMNQANIKMEQRMDAKQLMMQQKLAAANEDHALKMEGMMAMLQKAQATAGVAAVAGVAHNLDAPSLFGKSLEEHVSDATGVFDGITGVYEAGTGFYDAVAPVAAAAMVGLKNDGIKGIYDAVAPMAPAAMESLKNLWSVAGPLIGIAR